MLYIWCEYASGGLIHFYILNSFLFIISLLTKVGRNPICIPVNEMETYFHQAAATGNCFDSFSVLFCCLALSFSSLSYLYISLLPSSHTVSFPFCLPSLTVSLQLEPRPLGILYQWTWSSQQSSGRRSMKRRRKRTGQWRKLFKDSRQSWIAGGTVILALI